MFSIGVYEVLTVLIVMCVVGRPEEIPNYLRHIKKIYNYFVQLKFEIYNALENDNYIKGDDDKMYKSYKIEENPDKEIQ